MKTNDSRSLSDKTQIPGDLLTELIILAPGYPSLILTRKSLSW